LIYFVCKAEIVHADQMDSYNGTEEEKENITETRRRKSCLNDFRQCARKTIENYDDKRGSNERACNRWKDICKIHYPAIFKTIDETTEYSVITKKELAEFKRLQKENNKTVKVEKEGNKTITTTTEIDEDGNEKITKTIETIEELGKSEKPFIKTKSISTNKISKLGHYTSTENLDDELSDTNYADTQEEHNKGSIIQIEVKEQENLSPEIQNLDHKNDANSEVIKNSFNINNVMIDTVKEKEADDKDSDKENQEEITETDVQDEKQENSAEEDSTENG